MAALDVILSYFMLGFFGTVAGCTIIFSMYTRFAQFAQGSSYCSCIPDTKVLPPYLSTQLHSITFPPSFYLLPSCFTFQCGYLKELYPFQFLIQHPVQSDLAGAQHNTSMHQNQSATLRHSLNVKHNIIST